MRRWQKEEIDKAIKLHNEGFRFNKIGEQLDRSEKSVRVKLYSLNLTENLEVKHIIKECSCCSNKFESLISENRKFCSQTCSAKINNKGRKKIKNCLNCDDELGQYAKKYCSANCQQDFQRKKIFEDIENNNYHSLDSIMYKKFIYERDGEKCSNCGWSEINDFSGKIPLELHHIDCNPDNNDIDNLQILCPNCHSLTKNWKGITSGGGRHSKRRVQRRENYKNGKPC